MEHATRILQDLPESLVIDVGTGTGAIPLALARRQPKHRYLGLDVSSDALALARENASQPSSVPPEGTHMEWKQNDLLQDFTESATLITANLPYLTPEEIALAEPEVRHDPALALDGGKDGLDLIRRLLPQAVKIAPVILLECGPSQTETVSDLARKAGYTEITVHPDLTSRPRIVEARRNGDPCLPSRFA